MQTNIPLFLVAHLPAGNDWLHHHDISDQRHLCSGGHHRLHDPGHHATSALLTRILGVHQPGAHLPSGTALIHPLECFLIKGHATLDRNRGP